MQDNVSQVNFSRILKKSIGNIFLSFSTYCLTLAKLSEEKAHNKVTINYEYNFFGALSSSLKFEPNHENETQIYYNIKKIIIIFLYFSVPCSGDSMCQTGGDANKVCSAGDCVCRAGYSNHDGLCKMGKKLFVNRKRRGRGLNYEYHKRNISQITHYNNMNSKTVFLVRHGH